MSGLRYYTDAELNVIRDLCLDAVDRFVRDAGFTAPELMPVRYDQLRDAIKAAFEPEDGGS